MQKEVLTREIIKKDYKRLFLSCVLDLIIGTVISLLFIILFFILLYKTLPILAWIINFPFLLCVIIIVPIELSITCKKYYFICNNKFHIAKSVLVNYQEKTTYPTPKLSAYSTPHALYFNTYGKYSIPSKKFYQFSKTKMSDNGIANTSFVGDEFYLILVKNKIVYVYNTKLFELQE